MMITSGCELTTADDNIIYNQNVRLMVTSRRNVRAHSISDIHSPCQLRFLLTDQQQNAALTKSIAVMKKSIGSTK